MGVRDRIAKAVMGIKAYHSSPHDFDRFDLSKIGTGEGAQVYGHGLYFAENPAVSGQGGQYWDQFLTKFDTNSPERRAAEYLKMMQFDRAKALEKAAGDAAFYAKDGNEVAARKYGEAARLLESGKPVGPRTYEVNIKADPAQMLDWDKRIRPHQAEAINDTLELRMMQDHPDWRTYMQMQKDIPDATGKEAWQLLTSPEVARMKSPEASAFLQEHDIPGIRYLDEGSRGVPTAIADIERAMKQGGMYKGASPDMWASRLDELRQTPLTNNYVVFDPSIVNIMKKYGIAGAAPAGMGALADQSRYEVQP